MSVERWRRLARLPVAKIGALASVVVVAVVAVVVLRHSSPDNAGASVASVAGAGATGTAATNAPAGQTPGAIASVSAAPLPPGLSEVAAPAGQTQRPVPIKSAATFGTGVTAKVTHFQFGTVTDVGPGIISGVPEVTFTIEVSNASSAPIDADNVEVSAQYGSSPANLMAASPANLGTTTPISGQLAVGASATGTYAFAIPTNQQKNVTLTVWIDSNRPTVVLTGSTH